MGYLSSGSHFVDALCISEPWIHSPEHITSMNIPGYTEVLSLRSTNYVARPYGGIILYIQTSIYPEVEILQTHMGKRHDMIWLRLRDITWCFLYLPPATSSHIRQWNTDIIDHLIEDLTLYDAPYVLIGDFNAHLFGERNAHGRDLIALIHSFDMLCLNDGSPTYHHAGASTAIDLVLASSDLLPKLRFKVGDLSPDSLHCPIHLIYKNHTPAPVAASSGTLKHRLPPSSSSHTAADSKMSQLLSKVHQGKRGSGPVDYPRSKECPSMSSVRRRLRLLGKRELTPETSARITSLRQDWRLLSNRKLKEKRQECRRRMWEIRGRKGYWDHINNTRGSKVGISLCPEHVEKHFKALLDKSPSTPVGATHAKHKSNDHMPPDYYKTLGLPPIEPPPADPASLELWFSERKDSDILERISGDDLLGSPITSLEISFALAKLKNSAKGEDRVKIVDLRTVHADEIAQFFIELMETYEIPTCWHRAILVPIPKKGVPVVPSQLWGIAIQPALRRLFTACMERRLHKWCELHSVLPPVQSGFRPSFRTTENIFILRCLVERAVHKQSVLIGVSVDIEKAFDMVDRELLWKKCEQWGAKGALMDLVKLMYSDPKVTLKINAQYSDFMDTTNGVLQGCPLLPLLFICYMADIPITSWFDPVLHGIRISGLMLADDLMLLATSNLGAENKLTILEKYLGKHSMRLNAGKSWVLNLSTKRGVDPDVWCGDTKVPMGVGQEYNGWSLDSSPPRQHNAWQWGAHLMHRYKNLLSVTQSLMSLSKTLNVPTTSLASGLYRSLIEPELIYACESSFNCTVGSNLLYNCLQLKFLRFCLGLPSTAVGELVLWDCGQLLLVNRRLQLTSRFYAHLASLHYDRILYYAVRDSIALSVERKGWFHAFCSRCPLPVPDIDDVLACADFPALVQNALKDNQWRALLLITHSRATLRSLNWCQPSRSLTKATYLKLNKPMTRAVARLRFGTNNLAVHRLAWNAVPWEDRLCVACGEVETETHVFTACGIFDPERDAFRTDLAHLEGCEDCWSWGPDKLMRTLVNPGTLEVAKCVGYFLREVWREVDERYVI